MNKRLTLGGMLLAMAIPALAADKVATSGFYVSANGGQGQIYSPYAYMNGGTGTYYHNAFAWGLNVGYNQALNQNFSLGLELGYNDNAQSKYLASGGNNDTGSLEVHSNDWQLLGTANYLWADGINVFAKAGAADLNQRDNFVGPVTFPNTVLTDNFTNHKYGIKPMVAWGLGYQISNNFNLYAMGSYIFAKQGDNWDNVNTDTDVNHTLFSVVTWQLGLSYIFAS